MVNRSKNKGTAAETAVVNYLLGRVFPDVERRALSGSQDKGDIAGLRNWVVEVKDQARLDFSGWLKELAAEMKNANTSFGAVWAKRRGKSSPGDWYVMMTGEIFVQILNELDKNAMPQL